MWIRYGNLLITLILNYCMIKRGSIEISFGMIFSVIIIIVIIGIAVYAITSFLNIGESAEISLFYKELQKSIDDAWTSATTSRVITLSIPKSIELVCFGSLATGVAPDKYRDEMQELKEYSSGFQQQNTNSFLYPPGKAGDFAFKKVNKIDFSSLGTFDCLETRNGKISIRLSKSEFESLVKVGRE